MHKLVHAALAAALLLAAGCTLKEPASPGLGTDEFARLVIWRNPLARATAAPLVSDNTVYFLDTRLQSVTAVSRQNGDARWRTPPILSGSLGTPSGGLVLLPSALGVVSDELFALNSATGQQLWRFTPSIGPATTFRRVATDGTHFIVASSHIFSVDAASGKERWVRAVAADTLSPVINDIAVRDGVLYAGYLVYHPQPDNRGIGGILAVSASTGDVLWHRLFQDSTSDYWIDELEMNSLHLYAQDSKGRIQVLDKGDGQILHVIDKGGSGSRPAYTVTQLLTSDDTLIVSASGGQAAITAIDARTFDQIWSVNVPGFFVSQVVMDNSNVYAVASLGQLVVLDLRDGVMVAQRGTLFNDAVVGGVTGMPVSVDGRVYMGTYLGGLAILRP